MKKLTVLVVEDGQENMENAKKAFKKFKNIEFLYAPNFDEAEPLIEKADAGLFDLFFPKNSQDNGEKEMADFLEERKRKLELELDGLLPLGFILAKKMGSKPVVFVSNIYDGHGKLDNPFYECRRLGWKVNLAWYPVDGGFVRMALHYGRKKDEKVAVGWLAALKGVLKKSAHSDAGRIKLPAEVEESIEKWMGIK